MKREIINTRPHRWRKLFARAISALLTAAFLAGCGHKPETHAPSTKLPAVSVQVETVQEKPQTTTEEVVGTVQAKLRATLEAKVSGRVLAMPVTLGQKVKQGDLVAQLDASDTQARLEQAEAELHQAELDWNRTSNLFKQQAATQSEHDAADARYRVAKAAVAQAQAMLAYAKLLAPFDGVITRKLADVGDLASPGKPLAEMENPTAMQLEADVPEAIAPHISSGAKMTVRLDSPDSELVGVVSEIAPVADPLSRTFHVKVDLPHAPAVMSGQFARLVVPVGQSKTMRVPASAVVQRGELEIVFVAEKGQAQLRLVKTGRRSGDQVEILSGLEPGDSVITQNPALLADGQPVEVK